MPRLATLAELLDQVATKADMPAFDADTFVTKARAIQFINEGIAQLRDLLITNNAAAYFQKPATITTLPNVDTYDLQADHYKLLNVFWDARTGYGLQRMFEVQPNEDETQLTGEGWDYLTGGSRGGVRYEQLGPATVGGNPQIRFVPMPTGVYTVTVKYAPPAVKLAADGDVLDGVNGWELYPVYYAAAECQAKQDNFEAADRLKARMDEQGRRILVMARPNQGEPKRVQRVAGWWRR